MHDFHFLRPLWLAAIPLALLLTWGLGRATASGSAWQRVCDPALLQQLLVGAGGRTGRLPLILLALAWVLGCIAMAGPAWERQPQPVYGRLHSRVVVFDLSRSMDSGDLAPSRLVRARYKLSDLVAGGGDREQALVVFAGDAFVVAPLTDDSATLANLIPSLNTETVPVQGSRVDRALGLSLELLQRGAARNGEVVLFTDGVDPAYSDAARTAARELASRGHTLSVIGVGTASGAPVASPGGGFLTDGSGNIVVPGLDRQSLYALAAAGGGSYMDLRDDNVDIGQLNQPRRDVGRGTDEARIAGERHGWVDRGAILLLPILLLAAVAFRRGWLLLIAMALLPLPRPALALDWSSLWTRPDQRAAAALEAGNPEAVPETAGSRWQAAAAYGRGDFDQAVRLGSEPQSADDHYNLGNALARSGELDAAADSYRKALEMQPDMEDARFNLDLVEQAKAQQQEQQGASQDQGQGGGNASSGQQHGEQQDGEQQDGEQHGEEQQGGESQAGGEGRQQGGTPSGEADGESGEGDQSTSGSSAAEEPSSEPAPRPENVGAPQESAPENDDDGDSGTGESPADGVDSADGRADEQGEGGLEDLADLPLREQQQAMEQWLRQVPDDPGGLLRRKFHYQYGRRESPAAGGQSW